MKLVIAVVIACFTCNESTNCYVLQYEYKHDYYRDTVILPKHKLKERDTLQYYPLLSKLKP